MVQNFKHLIACCLPSTHPHPFSRNSSVCCSSNCKYYNCSKIFIKIYFVLIGNQQRRRLENSSRRLDVFSFQIRRGHASLRPTPTHCQPQRLARMWTPDATSSLSPNLLVQTRYTSPLFQMRAWHLEHSPVVSNARLSFQVQARRFEHEPTVSNASLPFRTRPCYFKREPVILSTIPLFQT